MLSSMPQGTILGSIAALATKEQTCASTIRRYSHRATMTSATTVPTKAGAAAAAAHDSSHAVVSTRDRVPLRRGGAGARAAALDASSEATAVVAALTRRPVCLLSAGVGGVRAAAADRRLETTAAAIGATRTAARHQLEQTGAAGLLGVHARKHVEVSSKQPASARACVLGAVYLPPRTASRKSARPPLQQHGRSGKPCRRATEAATATPRGSVTASVSVPSRRALVPQRRLSGKSERATRALSHRGASGRTGARAMCRVGQDWNKLPGAARAPASSRRQRLSACLPRLRRAMPAVQWATVMAGARGAAGPTAQPRVAMAPKHAAATAPMRPWAARLWLLTRMRSRALWAYPRPGSRTDPSANVGSRRLADGNASACATVAADVPVHLRSCATAAGRR